MKIAIIGCGYVADLYLQSMPIHPELELIAVYDRDAGRQRRFASFYKVPTVNSLDEIFHSEAELVLNLTNPRAHYEVSKACIEAGKHVYCEKPLAMKFREAEELTELGTARGLLVVSAPCNILGESAQTMWKALRENVIGEVYAVYAEMNDGLTHRMPYRSWFSKSGAPWPGKDEFEVGCTLEHSSYLLSLLCAVFGPAVSLTAFGSTTIKDKRTDEPLRVTAPDLSVTCVRFASGVVARLTCSIVAQYDHQVRVFGENGILGTKESLDYRSPVWTRRMFNFRRRMIVSPWKKRFRLLGGRNPKIHNGGSSNMDYCRGPAEMVNSLNEKRPCRLSPQFSLHVNELALAIDEAREEGVCRRITSTFDPIEPMPWAV
ncbi:MAG TPA: Gfo/Idh/MocA family oxidoreductase [Planctomycetaceae bacterium]|nr:Gfo/Idh/MocA family oxidoreductase [Planctomycetaceae bacterium]HQZ63562.1 Gfo/Idh/MocA family oxidoreductase [Planctomycetaceae bacterium]